MKKQQAYKLKSGTIIYGHIVVDLCFLAMQKIIKTFDPLHEALQPVKALVGTWDSTSAKLSYPTIKPATYCEELSFTSIGQPNLIYKSVTWNPENKPLHLESGFLKIQPGTEQLSFMVAHNFGLTSLEEGALETDDGEITIRLKSTNVSRCAFAKDPAVVGIERQFNLKGDTLQQIVSMATATTPMTEHLRVSYKKRLL